MLHITLIANTLGDGSRIRLRPERPPIMSGPMTSLLIAPQWQGIPNAVIIDTVYH